MKASDRTKTEVELAREEKEKLDELERKRLKRMRGEETDSEDEGEWVLCVYVSVCMCAKVCLLFEVIQNGRCGLKKKTGISKEA